MNNVQPTMMAAFLYLGAGIGLLIYSRILFRRAVSGRGVQYDNTE